MLSNVYCHGPPLRPHMASQTLGESSAGRPHRRMGSQRMIHRCRAGSADMTPPAGLVEAGDENIWFYNDSCRTTSIASSPDLLSCLRKAGLWARTRKNRILRLRRQARLRSWRYALETSDGDGADDAAVRSEAAMRRGQTAVTSGYGVDGREKKNDRSPQDAAQARMVHDGSVRRVRRPAGMA